MNSFRQSLTSAAVATALLASFALPSFAQTTAPDAAPAAVTVPAKPDAGPHKHHRDHKPGDRMEHMKQHMDKFKADLKLTPAQTSAWDTYAASMKPAERPQRMDRAEFAKLTTPQRIDKMRELRAQRNAAMDSRADATKAFYAQLNAEQQKTFDSATLRMHGHGDRHHGGKHHRHGGKPGQERPAPAAAQ